MMYIIFEHWDGPRVLRYLRPGDVHVSWRYMINYLMKADYELMTLGVDCKMVLSDLVVRWVATRLWRRYPTSGESVLAFWHYLKGFPFRLVSRIMKGLHG